MHTLRSLAKDLKSQCNPQSAVKFNTQKHTAGKPSFEAIPPPSFRNKDVVQTINMNTQVAMMYD